MTLRCSIYPRLHLNKFNVPVLEQLPPLEDVFSLPSENGSFFPAELDTSNEFDALNMLLYNDLLYINEDDFLEIFDQKNKLKIIIPRNLNNKPSFGYFTTGERGGYFVIN